MDNTVVGQLQNTLRFLMIDTEDQIKDGNRDILSDRMNALNGLLSKENQVKLAYEDSEIKMGPTVYGEYVEVQINKLLEEVKAIYSSFEEGIYTMKQRKRCDEISDVLSHLK
jgi:hypothetical protein